MSRHPAAPAWQVSQWFNTDAPLDLLGLRGQVIALHWAAPESPDTLDGNMCLGESDANPQEVHR